ncbi:transposase family protein [Nocardiopsis metallicus]|uniref:Transposase n=1 Tax=Nocardiopsis metallicus TaxID=179819 RepID=A0A840WTY1_9ACTN|nr:transposase family protein [Nocardiopsis metallicus]MBB5493608.1 hypothetical protein [Nocardiopsis metallicus]
MDLQRITGLSPEQLTELTARVHHQLGPLTHPGGRPAAIGLYASVALVVALHRHNLTQDLAGALFDVSQATVSRRWDLLRPLIAATLADLVLAPDATVGGSTVLVDGTLAATWDWKTAEGMYSGKHQTTGFNLQIACTPSGDIAAVGPVPVPGSRHDAHAYYASGLADLIFDLDSTLGDKGYQAHVDISPVRKPPGGELSPEQRANNTVINSVRAAVERAVAHLKNWRMLQTRYRAPLAKFNEALSVIIGLYFFTRYFEAYE